MSRTANSELARSGRRLSLDTLFALALAAAAVLAVTTGLFAVLESGFRQPAFDQFRMLIDYLGRPFPDNILQLENGHRPVIPALLRVLELHCCGGGQGLQRAIGTGLALLTALIPAWSAWREPGWQPVGRAAAAALAAMSVFWLANARILLHGHESVHVYLVLVSVVLAGWWTWRASQDSRPWRWLLPASLAAAVATYSFGPGIVAFPVVLLLAWAARIRGRALLLPAAGFALSLWGYLFVLPGEAGVRGSLHVTPLDNLAVALRWIASPWVHAWLGSAEPSLPSWLGEALPRYTGGALLRDSAAWLAPDGVLRSPLPLYLGAAGYALLGLCAWRAWTKPERLPRTAWIGLALAVFAGGTAVLIGLARLDYFARHPDQVFADRYLVWPSLFWAGLAIFGVSVLQGARTAWWSRAAAGMVLLLALALWPSHRAGIGWGQAAERLVARSEPAVLLGVFDPEVLPDNDAASRTQVEQSLALLRARGLGYFRRPLPAVVPVIGSAIGSASENVSLLGTTRLRNEPGGREVVRLQGRTKRPLDRDSLLVLVDQRGRVHGLAMPTHAVGDETWGQRLLGRRRGLDGYLVDPPAEPLAVIVFGGGRPMQVGTLAPVDQD